MKSTWAKVGCQHFKLYSNSNDISLVSKKKDISLYYLNFSIHFPIERKKKRKGGAETNRRRLIRPGRVKGSPVSRAGATARTVCSARIHSVGRAKWVSDEPSSAEVQTSSPRMLGTPLAASPSSPAPTPPWAHEWLQAAAARRFPLARLLQRASLPSYSLDAKFLRPTPERRILYGVGVLFKPGAPFFCN